jgi:hypothetical protein
MNLAMHFSQRRPLITLAKILRVRSPNEQNFTRVLKANGGQKA